MFHVERWDQGDRWDQRPISATAFLIVVLIVLLTWGAMSIMTGANEETGPTQDMAISSPILFGTRIGTNGSGDGEYH